VNTDDQETDSLVDGAHPCVARVIYRKKRLS
jgi:hypothetical protein